MREFATGATRDDDDAKIDFEGFLSPLVIRRFGQYMSKHRLQADGKLRDSDNWQRGIPKDQYIKSLFRHFVDVWLHHRHGNEPWFNTTFLEDALCAILFNVQGYLHEQLIGNAKEDCFDKETNTWRRRAGFTKTDQTSLSKT